MPCFASRLLHDDCFCASRLLLTDNLLKNLQHHTVSAFVIGMPRATRTNQ